jgi:hypothetical protein
MRGIVILSHASEIALGVKRLIEEVATNVPITIAGGLDDNAIGTSFDDIQAAIDSGFPIYLPAGTYEINSALTWDLDQGHMFGEGSRNTVIYQTAAGEHGIELTDSPEASGVTKSGIIERLRITGVGAGTSTGYGIYGFQPSTPSMAFLRGRDLYVRGFARGLSLERWDNSSFFGCEFNSNAVNVWTASQTKTVSFYNCVNTTATNACWQTAAGGHISIKDCDTGNGAQHVLSAGTFAARDSNFETVTGTPTAHIEQTGGSMLLDNITMLGGSSTVPAVVYTNAEFASVGIAGFGSGGGKIRKASASAVGYFGGQMGLSSNRQTATAIADNAGQFESLPFGVFDMVNYNSSSTPTAGNRTMIQYLAAPNGFGDDRIVAKTKLSGGTYVDSDILNRTLLSGVNTFTAANTFSNASISLTALPTYADNAAAVSGGLAVGRVYKTATGELRIVV